MQGLPRGLALRTAGMPRARIRKSGTTGKHEMISLSKKRYNRAVNAIFRKSSAKVGLGGYANLELRN